MRFFTFFLTTIFLLHLTACSNYVQKTDYKPIREIAEDAAPTPILFREIEMLLPVGSDVGFENDSSRFCGWPRYPVSRKVLKDAVDKKFIKQTFHDALEAQGYDVVGSLDLAYDLEDEDDRAEYSVTAKVKDVELEMCQNEPDNIMIFFSTRKGTEGELYMNVDWTIYDALRRTVVYKTSTQGYTKRRTPNQEGLELMFSDAFEMAAHNLGTDKDFYDLIVNGIKPQNWKKSKLQKDNDQRAHQFDPQEEVALPQQKLSREAFTKNIDRKRKAAVVVQKFGHASGFFITKQGHILTTADAVGNSLRTRIVTADKEEALTAEVLRTDRVRNVALLKLEEIPAGYTITTLPLRTGWPSVGEDVYAIGAPKHYSKSQDTVSKGIISAHRKDYKVSGIKQDYLQADLEIHKGSDGGPLIDKNGNIIGIATYINDSTTGLNYFIPVGDALRALHIGDDYTGAGSDGAPVSLLDR